MSVPTPISSCPDAPREGARESLLASAAGALRAAIAGLWRAPRYALPALLSVALGLGASTAVFAVFSAMILRPLPFPEEERLVRVGFPGASGVLPPTDLALSPPFLRDFQQLSSVFEGVSTERSWTGRLEIDGRTRRVGPQLVSPNFFDTLGIQALEGRLFTARGASPDGLDVIVLSEHFWRQELGAAPLVGTTQRYEGRPVTVLGIVRDEQAIPSDMDVWVPEDQAQQTRRGAFFGRGIARLAPGVTLEAAQARLTELSENAAVHTPTGTPVSARLMPLRENLIQPQRAWIALMLAAVGAFLLLAAANLAALLATRATARAHERAVRRALGSSAWVLARQSALDAGLIGLIGAALGLALARAGIAFANDAYREYLGNTPARLDARVLAACALAAVLCALAGALAPVVSLRRVQPADALRGEGRSTDTPRARRAREVLLVLQVALTTVLLINAGLVVRSVRSLLAVNTGFSTRDVLTAGVLVPMDPLPPSLGPEARQRAFDARSELMLAKARAVLEGLRHMNGVTQATVTIDVPFDWHSWPLRAQLPPGATQEQAAAILHFVGPGFFDTLGIRLLSGSDFGTELADPGRDIAVVSRSFAAALGVADAVGQRFRVVPPEGAPAATQPWIEIIGMVDDTIENDLTGPPPLQVYLPFAHGALSVSGPTAGAFQVAVRGRDPDALQRELASTVTNALPGSSADLVRSMEDWVAQSFWQRSALSRVLSALAIASVLLSAIGLFGITGFAVTQRTGEVGIRRALGATRRSVLQLVLFDTLRVVAIGVILGALGSWVTRQLLATFLFGVEPLDVTTYGAVALGVGVVAVLAALAPGRAASRVSPAHALTWR
jgi:putative ABC transport system permease protein